MNGIGWAVKELHNGKQVRRAGWNYSLVLGKREQGGSPIVNVVESEKTYEGWFCPPNDLLATDWEIAT
jgi:hypothetical protein